MASFLFVDLLIIDSDCSSDSSSIYGDGSSNRFSDACSITIVVVLVTITMVVVVRVVVQ